MDKISFQNVLTSFQDKQVKVLSSKGGDYAKEDLLSNFKEVAATVGITPAQVALTLICVKTSRLGTLLANLDEPNNESIIDSVLDLANYSFLLHVLVDENNAKLA